MKLSLIDRAIASFAPHAALRRVQARHALELVERRYEGASRGRRTAGWRTNPLSANALTYTDLPILRDRSRDLERNNPWARKAIQVTDTAAVGGGIVPQFHGDSKARCREIELRWADWADSTDCDAAGLNTFYGLQGLVVRTMAVAGEALVRRRRRGRGDGLPAPLQIEVLEPDHLDTDRDGPIAGSMNRRVQGIELDALNRRVAYHLYRDHPGDAHSTHKWQSVPVPAEAIAHLFRVDRPGQMRGVPWLAPAVLRLRDFDEYEDAHLLRQKIAACFVGTVTSEVGGGPSVPAAVPDELESMEPGSWKYLRPGEEVSFSSPPAVEGLDAYAVWHLRAIAAGCGISYEALTGDLSRGNFSSARIGWLLMEQEMRSIRRRLLIPRFCARSVGWFLEALELQGVNTRGVWASWTPPRREMLDPLKDVKADRDEIAGGLASWSEKVRARGFDPEDLREEIAEERKEFERLGLSFAAPAGSAPAEAPKGGGQESEGED